VEGLAEASGATARASRSVRERGSRRVTERYRARRRIGEDAVVKLWLPVRSQSVFKTTMNHAIPIEKAREKCGSQS
jgi:hypothetical protein